MDLTKDFYVNLKNGRFDSTTAEQMDDAFVKWDADPTRPLIVHFHGGLVNEPSGMKVAARLLPFYWDSGGYPLFFVWEAGAIEVLTHNLGEIFDERFFKRLLQLVTKFVIGKLDDGAARGAMISLPPDEQILRELRLGVPREVPFENRSATELPPDAELTPAQEQQFRRMIEVDPTLATEIQAIANSRRAPADIAREAAETRGGRIRTVTHSLIDQEVVEAVEAEPGRGLFGLPTRIVKGAVVIVYRIIKRFAKRRDHGVYVTIIEEILREFYVANAGQLIWNLMKADTEDAFAADARVFGGTRLLDRLAERLAADPSRKVILVGHSTGAVYICSLLKIAVSRLPAGTQVDVLFLAPANTFNLLEKTLAVANSRIRNIRIFGMQDTVERDDHMVPVVYPASLLYFVSGVCEKGQSGDEGDTPIVGLQRFYEPREPYQNNAAVQAVTAFLGSGGRLWSVWSVADTGLGFACDARKHGDLDNFETDSNPATIRPAGASVRHIVRNGYV
jgi:hypothetical protein